MLSLRGVVRDEAISVFGQRLLRSAAQKQIFSPPSQALPGTAVVRNSVSFRPQAEPGDEHVSRFYLKA